MTTTTTIRSPGTMELDRRAAAVAAALEVGDHATALALTELTEQSAGLGWESWPIQSPAPVIARRFARAHRRLLAEGSLG